MTYSINWPITVRSAVPFCSIPEIISCRPGQHVEKPDTLDLFPSTVWEPKIEGLDLYTHVYICMSVSGSSWNFQPDKWPQNRTVRFKP